jgi:hypothetical protein
VRARREVSRSKATALAKGLLGEKQLGDHRQRNDLSHAGSGEVMIERGTLDEAIESF